MPTTTTPVASTGPTQQAITDLKALRKRIENMELALKRLQANRNPQTFEVKELSNAPLMSKAVDQQFMMYEGSLGQYAPSYVSVIRNEYGNSFVEIVGSQITIQSGGCGPILVTGPGLNVDCNMDVQFTATFHQETIFDGEALFVTSQVSMGALPTSSSGLSSGRLWRSGTSVMIVP
jgi:hypothetical protein